MPRVTCRITRLISRAEQQHPLVNSRASLLWWGNEESLIGDGFADACIHHHIVSISGPEILARQKVPGSAGHTGKRSTTEQVSDARKARFSRAFSAGISGG
jgi:hypothetical protein